MAEREHVIVGTAGHIDHGKSALVKALTGIDPDTLPEEKERGLTIELGFVFLNDPSYEKQIVFIDVPGHEKFVKTMVAGASSVDAALFVIAADEGISVQTREHFDILQLLRIPVGMVALTKSDLADEARLAELKEEVARFVEGTFLEGAPVVPVSAVTGAGVTEVRKTLQDIGRRLPARPDSGFFRLPVDRVFTMRGFGTVIAGTVLSGEVHVGDRVEIYPDKITARVRGIQVHKEQREKSSIGKRTALNLQDVDRELLRRGQVAALPGSLTPSQRMDARLRLIARSQAELKSRDRVRLHVGTDEIIGRVVLLDKDRLLPGESALVQFNVESPAVALLGDRFIIRTFSPLLTIGGGEILDGTPPRHKRFNADVLKGLGGWEGETTEIVEQSLLKSGTKPLSAAEVAVSVGRSQADIQAALEPLVRRGSAVQVGADKEIRYLAASAFENLRETVLETIKAYFEENPHQLQMPQSGLRARFLKMSDEATFRALLDGLEARKDIYKKDVHVGLPGREVKVAARDQEWMNAIERKFSAAKFEPPLEEDVRRELRLDPSIFRRLMHALFEQGKLVRLNVKVVYHRDAFQEAKQAVVAQLQKSKSITIAGLRDRLKMSRKYSHALLEYFDRTGLTKRLEDRHVLR
jgi:selenocysteine-specific elongation factor